MDAVDNGLGKSGPAYDEQAEVLASRLQDNIYAFSAAKSLTQMIHYRDLMIGEDGKLLEYGSFRKRVADQGAVFNDQYLKAEFECAKYSAIMAHKWDTIQAEYLQYSTVGDRRVRPEHAVLDKFTALKTDKIWDKIYPPKAYGCRCNVVPGKPQGIERNPITDIEAGRMMSKQTRGTIFDNHVGKTKVIFDKPHPYFVNLKGQEKEISWERYGLRSLDKIKLDNLPQYKGMNLAQFHDWWDTEKKSAGTDLSIRDRMGQSILLRSGDSGSRKNRAFKQHVLDKAEARFEYAAEAKTLLTNPDEIWNSKQGRIYLKFYEHGTLKLVVDQKLEARTIFKLHDLDSGELQKARRGVLLYKK